MDKTAKLYNGEVLVRFAEAQHKYTIDAARKVSVTTVTNMVDGGKSGRLQGWAVKTVVLHLQFTLMNMLDNDGILTITAKKLVEIIKEAKEAYRKKKEEAADLGTQVHEWVEAHIRAQMGDGTEPNDPETLAPPVRSGVLAYLSWERKHKVQYVATECLVYSREWDYTGTADIVAYVDGVLSLVDIKTSNRLYATYHLQVAAYLHALNEEGSLGTVRRRYIVQLSKQSGTFEVEDLDGDNPDAYERDFTAFTSALNLYWRFRNE